MAKDGFNEFELQGDPNDVGDADIPEDVLEKLARRAPHSVTSHSASSSLHTSNTQHRLHESTSQTSPDPLIKPLVAQLADTIGLLRKVISIHDAILQEATKCDYEVQQLEYGLQFAEKSTLEFVQLLNKQIPVLGQTNDVEEFTQLHKRAQEDQQTLVDRIAVAKEAQGNLRTRQFEAITSDTALVLDLKNALEGLGLNTNVSEYNERTVSESSGKEEDPPALKRYYECKGQLGIIMERIGELNHEQKNAIEQRGRLVDQEASLDETDSEFLKPFDDKRAALNDQLIKAETDVQQLEDECIAAGIEIPRVFNEESSDTEAPADDLLKDKNVTFLVAGPDGPVAIPSRPAVPKDRVASTYVTSRLHSGSSDINHSRRPTKQRRHIMEWLEDVSTGEVGQTTTQAADRDSSPNGGTNAGAAELLQPDGPISADDKQDQISPVQEKVSNIDESSQEVDRPTRRLSMGADTELRPSAKTIVEKIYMQARSIE